jgi:hypothetical protein
VTPALGGERPLPLTAYGLILLTSSGLPIGLMLVREVRNESVFRKYIAEIPAFIAKHSGKYIVQGVQPTTIEGDWRPERRKHF